MISILLLEKKNLDRMKFSQNNSFQNDHEINFGDDEKGFIFMMKICLYYWKNMFINQLRSMAYYNERFFWYQVICFHLTTTYINK
jgi:hypothetical protein